MEAKENNICYGVDMSEEIWKDIPGYEGIYQVSNYGGYKILPKDIKCRGGKTRHIKEKIAYPNGDTQIALCKNKHYTYILFKIIVASAFIDEYCEGSNIIFVNNNKNNCRLDNIIIQLGLGDSKASTVILSKTDSCIENIPVIEGGFSEHSRILFDITLANKIGTDVTVLRNVNIVPNLNKLIENVDYIDLAQASNFINYASILIELGYTSSSLRQLPHVFIFSERGVAKLMATLHNSNPAKWEFLNKFVDEYFNMRKELREVNTPQISERDMALLAIINSKTDLEQAMAIKHFEEVTTKPLIEENTKIKDKLNKMGIKPPYTISSICSATGETKGVIEQYILDNGWIVRRIKDGSKRGFIPVNEDYVSQAGEAVWGIHFTQQGAFKLLEIFKEKQTKLWPVNV